MKTSQQARVVNGCTAQVFLRVSRLTIRQSLPPGKEVGKDILRLMTATIADEVLKLRSKHQSLANAPGKFIGAGAERE